MVGEKMSNEACFIQDFKTVNDSDTSWFHFVIDIPFAVASYTPLHQSGETILGLRTVSLSLTGTFQNKDGVLTLNI